MAEEGEVRPLLAEETGTVIPVDVRVARVFGLNEALFLSRLNYWLQKMKGNEFGRYDKKGNQYISNPANTETDNEEKKKNKWSNQLPYSGKTVLRVIKRLEIIGVVIRNNNLNYSSRDHTTWCRIDYKKFEEFMGIDKPIKYPTVYRYGKEVGKPVKPKKTKNIAKMTNGQNQILPNGQNLYSDSTEASKGLTQKDITLDNQIHVIDNKIPGNTNNMLPVSDIKNHGTGGSLEKFGELASIVEDCGIIDPCRLKT